MITRFFVGHVKPSAEEKQDAQWAAARKGGGLLVAQRRSGAAEPSLHSSQRAITAPLPLRLPPRRRRLLSTVFLPWTHCTHGAVYCVPGLSRRVAVVVGAQAAGAKPSAIGVHLAAGPAGKRWLLVFVGLAGTNGDVVGRAVAKRRFGCPGVEKPPAATGGAARAACSMQQRWLSCARACGLPQHVCMRRPRPSDLAAPGSPFHTRPKDNGALVKSFSPVRGAAGIPQTAGVRLGMGLSKLNGLLQRCSCDAA